jgi:hypothetical protein
MTEQTELERIWEDQRAFNALLRPAPTDEAERGQLTKDMVILLTDELHELLRTTVWKKHRNTPHRGNRPHTIEELADAFKFFISLCQVHDVTVDQLLRMYWDKTAVVKQRYDSEWKAQLTDCVVVDIDNVIGDYITCICQWLAIQYPSIPVSKLNEIRREGRWVNAQSLGIPEPRWQLIKHTFRTSGAKRDMPVFPDAKRFLEGMRAMGLQIVLLTSRPIDGYPNMYTDTILWLQKSGLLFDHVWWAHDKPEALQNRDIVDHVVAAVDDDMKFVSAYRAAGIPVFHLVRGASVTGVGASNGVHTVSSLHHIQPILTRLILEATDVRRR